MRHDKNEMDPLPWDDICKEVTKVAKRICKSKYCSQKYVLEYIEKYPDDFPAIHRKSEWHPETEITRRVLLNRIHQAGTKMGWPKYNQSRSRRKASGVFILPWVPEDELLIAAKQEVQAATE